MDERQILCDECAAACDRIAGVRATEWSVDPATGAMRGVMRWGLYEAIAMGTESLCRTVTSLRDPGGILQCTELPCPRRRAPT
jgi:hypothetical protein